MIEVNPTFSHLANTRHFQLKAFSEAESNTYVEQYLLNVEPQFAVSQSDFYSIVTGRNESRIHFIERRCFGVFSAVSVLNSFGRLVFLGEGWTPF